MRHVPAAPGLRREPIWAVGLGQGVAANNACALPSTGTVVLCCLLSLQVATAAPSSVREGGSVCSESGYTFQMVFQFDRTRDFPT